MAKILFAWETGAGWGHTLVHREVIGELIARGHEVHFAMRDLSRAVCLDANWPVMLHQAPAFFGRPPSGLHVSNAFPEILNNVGFHDVSILKGIVCAWRNLLEYIQPDLVVADYCPAALLAMRTLNCRKVVIGTGFCCPPDETPFPHLRPWIESNPEALWQIERRILGNVNAVLRLLGSVEVGRLAQIFCEVDDTILATYKDLDHYPDRGDADYWGTAPPPVGSTPCWPAGNRRKVFAYLRGFKTLPVLLELLARLELPTIVYSDGFEESDCSKYTTSTLTFTTEPVDLTLAAQQCDIAILNSPHATTATFLLSGKPVLLFPKTLESELLARRVAGMGAGLLVPPDNPKEVYRQLANLLNSPSYREAALQFAERNRGVSPSTYTQRVVARMEALLANHNQLPLRNEAS